MLTRLLKHLTSPGWWARRVFRNADLMEIADAVKASETRHRGEIRIAIEGSLPWRSLWSNESCRQRAATLFSTLGVANTREANGVLVYIQLVDRQVEILADRGIAGQVPEAAWRDICRQMETAFTEGEHCAGVLVAITRIGKLLATHYPATGSNPNELGDTPVLL